MRWIRFHPVTTAYCVCMCLIGVVWQAGALWH